MFLPPILFLLDKLMSISLGDSVDGTGSRSLTRSDEPYERLDEVSLLLTQSTFRFFFAASYLSDLDGSAGFITSQDEPTQKSTSSLLTASAGLTSRAWRAL